MDPLIAADKLAAIVWTAIHRSGQVEDPLKSRLRRAVVEYRMHRTRPSRMARLLGDDEDGDVKRQKCAYRPCSGPLLMARKNQRFCSPKCRKAAHKARHSV